MEEEQPSFSVDLVLDASASCMDYQETLAAQSYVIAQSLQKCRIPVQVTSFSSLRSYTVIHRFIRYNETDKTRIYSDILLPGGIVTDLPCVRSIN